MGGKVYTTNMEGCKLRNFYLERDNERRIAIANKYLNKQNVKQQNIKIIKKLKKPCYNKGLSKFEKINSTPKSQVNNHIPINSKEEEQKSMGNVDPLKIYFGRLKFFNPQKNFGFIIAIPEYIDVFVFGDEFQKAGIPLYIMNDSKSGSNLSFLFNIEYYKGKHGYSKKAVNIKLAYNYS